MKRQERGKKEEDKMPREEAREEETDLCAGDILGLAYPLDLVADLFDGVDEAPDVAGDIVEEVHRGHGSRGGGGGRG